MLSNSHHHNPFHMKSSRHSIELANADITRLMDPSYHPTNYGASSTEPARAYIDRRGQMHDPDFHYFPVYEGAGKNNNRRARRISDPVARSRIQFEDEDVDLEQYEEEEIESRSRQYNRRHNTRRPRSSQSHTYSISSFDSSYPSSSASSPSTTSSPLPYSSVSEDKPRHHHHSLLTRKFRRQSSDSTPPSSPLSYSSPLDFDDYSDVEDVQQSQPSANDVDEDEHQEVSAQQPQTTFSYSHAMRKQWLALSLSMRFGLLRARRRASSNCRSNRN